MSYVYGKWSDLVRFGPIVVRFGPILSDVGPMLARFPIHQSASYPASHLSVV